MSGVFKLVDTSGVQLDIILHSFNKLGYIVDWVDFYHQAIQAGWTLKTIRDKIKYNLIEVHGQEYTNRVMERLELYITQLE